MGILSKEKIILTPVVVLSTHLMGYGVIRSLGRMGVPVIAVYYQKKDMGYVSKYVKKKIFFPHPEFNEKDFLHSLVELNKEIGRCVIIPADDSTLAVVSRNYQLLSDIYTLGCPNWEVAQKYLIKRYTYKIAENVGVEYPKTYYYTETDHFQNLDIKFPVLVKPCQSHKYYSAFNTKMTVVENYPALEEACRLSKKNDIEVMIQEIVIGEEKNGINYNSLMINGEIIADFTAQKIRYTPSCYGVPCSTESIDPIPGIKEASEKVLRAMNFEGYSCIEFKKDEKDHRYKLLEINGRFNRSIMHATAAGINFPWLYYHYITRGTLPGFNKEYKRNMYWIDESHDPIICFKNHNKHNVIQLLKPYLGKKVYANFDLKDMKPFLKRITDVFKCLLNNIKKS